MKATKITIDIDKIHSQTPDFSNISLANQFIRASLEQTQEFREMIAMAREGVTDANKADFKERLDRLYHLVRIEPGSFVALRESVAETLEEAIANKNIAESRDGYKDQNNTIDIIIQLARAADSVPADLTRAVRDVHKIYTDKLSLVSNGDIDRNVSSWSIKKNEDIYSFSINRSDREVTGITVYKNGVNDSTFTIKSENLARYNMGKNALMHSSLAMTEEVADSLLHTLTQRNLLGMTGTAITSSNLPLQLAEATTGYFLYPNGEVAMEHTQGKGLKNINIELTASGEISKLIVVNTSTIMQINPAVDVASTKTTTSLVFDDGHRVTGISSTIESTSPFDIPTDLSQYIDAEKSSFTRDAMEATILTVDVSEITSQLDGASDSLISNQLIRAGLEATPKFKKMLLLADNLSTLENLLTFRGRLEELYALVRTEHDPANWDEAKAAAEGRSLGQETKDFILRFAIAADKAKHEIDRITTGPEDGFAVHTVTEAEAVAIAAQLVSVKTTVQQYHDLLIALSSADFAREIGDLKVRIADKTYIFEQTYTDAEETELSGIIIKSSVGENFTITRDAGESDYALIKRTLISAPLSMNGGDADLFLTTFTQRICAGAGMPAIGAYNAAITGHATKKTLLLENPKLHAIMNDRERDNEITMELSPEGRITEVNAKVYYKVRDVEREPIDLHKISETTSIKMQNGVITNTAVTFSSLHFPMRVPNDLLFYTDKAKTILRPAAPEPERAPTPPPAAPPKKGVISWIKSLFSKPKPEAEPAAPVFQKPKLRRQDAFIMTEPLSDLPTPTTASSIAVSSPDARSASGGSPPPLPVDMAELEAQAMRPIPVRAPSGSHIVVGDVDPTQPISAPVTPTTPRSGHGGHGQ